MVFFIYSNFNRTICNQTVETLIRCCVMACLIGSALYAYVPQKKTLGFYGLKTNFSHLSHNVIVYVLKYLVCYNLTSPGDNGSHQLII